MIGWKKLLDLKKFYINNWNKYVFTIMALPLYGWSIVGNQYVCSYCDTFICVGPDMHIEQGDELCFLERGGCGCCGAMLDLGECHHYVDSDSD